jgi:CheY-like chemotaxis protein
VILPDLALPKADALGVLGCIRGDERTRLPPVVILTSSGVGGRRRRPRRGGQQSGVRKPAGVGRFREAVVEAGTHWVLSNEPPPPR